MIYGYMFGTEQPDEDIYMPEGRVLAGYAIGIIRSGTAAYPQFPGNVANASTFDFPVYYKILPPTTEEQLLSAEPDPAILEETIKAARELEELGVRAIVGACGFFANYLTKVAAAVNVPTFLSSLMQIPIISRALNPSQKVGVITANANVLSPVALKACGVNDPSTIVITGAQDLPQMQNFLRSTGRHINSRKLEQELVDLSKQMVSENPDIGALLLECSDMPPYAWAIQKAVGLPVFDYITMINWVYNAVVRRPFAGFM